MMMVEVDGATKKLLERIASAKNITVEAAATIVLEQYASRYERLVESAENAANRRP